jgi:hypothetical protein
MNGRGSLDLVAGITLTIGVGENHGVRAQESVWARADWMPNEKKAAAQAA